MRITILPSLCICLISNVKAQCSTYIQMVPTAECILPEIVATHEILTPCSSPPGFNQLKEGDFAFIDFIESGCTNFCQVSKEYDITCFNLPVGIGDPESTDEIKIFPTLVLDRIYIEGNDIIQIVLYNDRGAEVMKLKEPDMHGIDLGDLVVGIYFIRVKTKNKIWVRKIIKLDP